MNVHFICRGNAHRSVMAEAYLKSLNLPNVTVRSSGTVADENWEVNRQPFRDTISLLDTHGIASYAKKSSEQLTQDRLDENDITICVNSIAYNEGLGIVSFPKNTIIWDIDDTGEGNRLLGVGDESTKYDELIFEEIQAHVDRLVRDYKLKNT